MLSSLRFSSSDGSENQNPQSSKIAGNVRVQSIDDHQALQQPELPSADVILVTCVATNFGRPSPRTIDLGRIQRDSSKGQCLYIIGNLKSLIGYTDEWKSFIQRAQEVGRIHTMSSLYETDLYQDVIQKFVPLPV